MSLASFLSYPESVETRQEFMEKPLLQEIGPMKGPAPHVVEKWFRNGLPTAFTSNVLDRIVKKLEEDGSYVRQTGDRDSWKGANLHAKEQPKDESKAQAEKAKWLNGLSEKIITIMKAAFPNDKELQKVQLLRKWVSSPNTLIEGLRKPDLVLLPVGLTNTKVAETGIYFEDIVTSCEVKYTHNYHLSKKAKFQASEMALFCMWKQVDRCYYIAFSICGNLLTVYQYTRGGVRSSPAIDIDRHPQLFVRLLLTISVGKSLWLGYDPWITNVEIGDQKYKQVELRGRRVEYLGEGDIKPVEATKLTFIHPIFMAYGLKGRGTRIWLVRDAKQRYIILKDCWLPRTWYNDITIHQRLQDPSREDPQFAVEARSEEDEAIFGDEDKYHIFDNPFFDDPGCDGLKGIPTLVYWDEVQRPDEFGALLQETTAMLLGQLPEADSIEDRLHLRAGFRECGIGISWFSCAREFFNAIMGTLVGHYNGYVRRKMLQCDISDTNLWLRIPPHPTPETIVPDWPENKGPEWYPKRTGLLGDWGYGEDVSDKSSRQMDDSCPITGTFPFQAVQLMAWDAGLHWAGEFTGHSVQHDLEAVMWLMWVLCVNMDGPYNKKRFRSNDFENPTRKGTKRKAEASGINSTSQPRKKGTSNTGGTQLVDVIDNTGAKTTPQIPSTSMSTTLPNPVPTNATRSPPEHKPFLWARPALYEEKFSEVALAKSSGEKHLFLFHLSPYFSKHPSVVQGFSDLFQLFSWTNKGVLWKDNALQIVQTPPAPTTYKKVIDIIKNMRDGIDPKKDGPPPKAEMERARKEVAASLKKGHLETSLFANRAGPSRDQGRSRKG